MIESKTVHVMYYFSRTRMSLLNARPVCNKIRDFNLAPTRGGKWQGSWIPWRIINVHDSIDRARRTPFTRARIISVRNMHTRHASYRQALKIVIGVKEAPLDRRMRFWS